MRFDWCKTNLHPVCYDYTQDHCEGCNIARAYLHGYKTAQGDALKPSEWIPVSEALPEKDKEVLISLEWGVDIGQYDGDGWRSEWINHYDDDNVLAWQSLPKPYREDGEG